jgi:hypothetical protein
MPNELQRLARAVLAKNAAVKRDSTWDSRGTVTGQLYQSVKIAGTAKTEINQDNDPSVPLFQALGDGTVGQSANSGTPLGTLVGQYYREAFTTLAARCPTYVPEERWHQAIADATTLTSKWGEQAHAFGWTPRDLFGLHPVPEQPAGNYSRLSRLDHTGLIWLLRGRPVIALTAAEAVMRCQSGATLTYRKLNKPALGPLGDGLDDMGPTI